MDALFVNDTQVDEATLLAWNRAELWWFHRWYLVLSGVMLAVCAGVLGGFVYAAATTGMLLFAACAGVVALLMALQLAGLWLWPRFYVRGLMRKSETRFPIATRTFFYEGELAALSFPRGEEYEALERELEDLKQAVDGIESMDEAARLALREKFEELEDRLEALNRAAGGEVLRRGESYGGITACLVSKELVVLYYDSAAVLLRWDGFSKDSTADFAAFLKGKLAAAYAAAGNDKTGKNLAAAIRELGQAAKGEEQEQG